MRHCRAGWRFTAPSSAAIHSIRPYCFCCVSPMGSPRPPFLVAAVAAAVAGCTMHRSMNSTVTSNVTRAPYGRLPDGRGVDQFTLVNAHGVQVQVITYGAIITGVRTPDRADHLEDIALGFDSLPGYLGGHPYFGAIVGRYANRIAHGQFTLDGVTYHLSLNNGPNSLHGGKRGFDKVLWTGDAFRRDDSVGVALRYTSPDGEEGYPGALAVRVTYTLTARDELIVDYEGTTDKATPVNLSQHSYWNLG